MTSSFGRRIKERFSCRYKLKISRDYPTSLPDTIRGDAKREGTSAASRAKRGFQSWGHFCVSQVLPASNTSAWLLGPKESRLWRQLCVRRSWHGKCVDWFCKRASPCFYCKAAQTHTRSIILSIKYLLDCPWQLCVCITSNTQPWNFWDKLIDAKNGILEIDIMGATGDKSG